MLSTLHLRAPAKLNLYLRVLGRRPDGFHEIETLYERIDLADELTFEADPHALILTCTDSTLSCGEDNLILRAARLLQRTCGLPPPGRAGSPTGRVSGARMHLIKRIPVAAGLGGGSSDAATTLLGLNRLWDLRLDRPCLVELAGQIGSDVPFFLSEASFAIGRGRGEVCEPLAEDARLVQVLVMPNERLSTTAVYTGAQFDLTAPKPSSTMILHALRNGSLGELAEGLWNDLEPEAIRRCPSISRIQLQLRNLGCVGTLLSGSGPAVFGLCTDHAHAPRVASALSTFVTSHPAEPGWPWRIEVVQTERPSSLATPTLQS